MTTVQPAGDVVCPSDIPPDVWRLVERLPIISENFDDGDMIVVARAILTAQSAARENFLTMQQAAAKLLEDCNSYKAAMTANLARALAAEARLLAAEKALDPFKRISDDIPSSFSDETVVSIGIDYKLSAEQVADIQGMTGGAIKSDRATIVLSMACLQASHFRAARSAINLIRGG